MRLVLRVLRTCIGRIRGEIARQLYQVPPRYQDTLMQLLDATRRILTQRPKDKNKLYALHAPEVECIAKGGI